jgi:hypothetical protein
MVRISKQWRWKMSEWIEWTGGERPVGYGVNVEVRFRDGTSWATNTPEFYDWGADNVKPIVAYRLVEAEAAPAEPYYGEPVEIDDIDEWLAGVNALESSAAGIASRAAELVGGDRDRQHGAKKDNFDRIACVWNAWLDIRKEPASRLTARHASSLRLLRLPISGRLAKLCLARACTRQPTTFPAMKSTA